MRPAIVAVGVSEAKTTVVSTFSFTFPEEICV